MVRHRASKLWLCSAGIGIVGLVTGARGAITVDGTLNEADYGVSAPGTSALATQTIDSSFGSNQLDAAYASVQGGNLYLFFSGNLQSGGNTLQIWFDDGRAGGQNTLNASSGAGNMNKMNGSIFSPDFHATYALEMNVAGGSFFLDQYNLLGNTATFLGSFPVANNKGSSTNLSGIAAGYDNSNTGGILNGSQTAGSAASATLAQAVSTGIELAIPLSTFGNPSSLKVLAGINGSNDSGLSNQMLAGVQVGTDSIKTQPGTLAGPAGNQHTAINPYYLGTTGNSMKFTFANFPGQYFTVPIPAAPNGVWLPTGGGSWNNTTNWSNGVIPNLAGDAATFTTATGASTVNLDGTHSVATLAINDSNSYTFAAGSGGVLVMDNGSNGAAINDLGGVHVFSTPVVLNSTTTITEQNHGDAITMSGNISGVGGLTIANSGIFNTTHSTVSLTGNNSWQGPTTISRGELQLGSPTALPAGTSLTISSSSPRGLLDINGFGAVVSSITVTGAATGTNPLATITTSNTSAGISRFTYAGSMANPSTFKGTISDSGASGGSTLALAVASGSLTLSGNNTYAGGTTVSSGATVTFATTIASASALPINSSVVNDGAIVFSNTATANAISGAGSTTVSNGTLAATTINQGSLTINDSSRVALAANGNNTVHLGGLTVGDNTAGTGAQLDLNDNDLVVSYAGTSPADSIRALLSEGFNVGSWDGNGIASAAAHADVNLRTALGYGDNGSAVTVKYTYYGDSDLNGSVDTADFQKFLDGLAGGGSTWAQGDYTYDGVVDLGNDFNLFLDTYVNQGSSLGDLAAVIEGDAGLSNSQKAQLLAVVPEPSSLALVGIAVCGVARRRRKV